MSADRQLSEEVAGILQQKDTAYSERNKLVAALARMALVLGWKAGVAQHEGEPWDADWRTTVYVDLPTGQVSWHFHDSEKRLLYGLPNYEGGWDGHTTEEKYARLGKLFNPVAGALLNRTAQDVLAGLEKRVLEDRLARALAELDDAVSIVTKCHRHVEFAARAKGCSAIGDLAQVDEFLGRYPR